MSTSLASRLADLPKAERDEVLASLTEAERQALLYDWDFWARPEQRMPNDPWSIVWISGGRRSGKTRAGAEAAAQLARDNPGVDGGIVAPTFQADALRKCVEGASGILKPLGDLVSNYNRSEGVIYLRTGGTIFATGAEKGAPHIQGENLGWCWCVHEDEPVLTRRGWVPIRDVVVGDQAATRKGWRDVTAHALMRRAAPVLRIVATGGESVRCTADHPVWAEGRGFIPAGDVRVGDTLRLWNTHQDHLRGTTGMAPGGIASATATTRTGQECRCTQSFGSARTSVVYQTGSSSTTSITTEATTSPRTCKRCCQSNTSPSMDYWADHTTMRPRPRSVLHRSDRGPIVNHDRASASNAVATTCPPASGLSSAHPLALARSSVKSIELAGNADVYDITVADAHEFFAGGILVKNCDEVGLWPRSKWKMAWEESIQFAVMMSPARIVCTGTPKAGHPLIKLLPGLLLAPYLVEVARGDFGRRGHHGCTEGVQLHTKTSPILNVLGTHKVRQGRRPVL